MATVTDTPAADVFGPLDRLRRALVRYVLWDALAVLALGLAVWFWLGFALDYGLFKLTGVDLVEDAPTWVRGLVLAALAGLLGYVTVRAGRRLWGTISYPALALALERRFPAALEDRVITAVELADTAAQERAGYSPAMLRQTSADAAERLARVPVESVLDWHRLRDRAWRAVIVAAVPLVGLAIGLGLKQSRAPKLPAAVLTVQQWAERTFLLRDAAWPRRAFVKLVGVPTTGIRVGRDAPPPKLTAVASEWVWADRSAPGGWRPMVGSDLLQFYTFPTGQPVADDEPADRFLERPEFVYIKEDLVEIAANPWNARRVRRLERPAGLTLVYAGLPVDNRPSATNGSAKLLRQADCQYLGELTGLKESIRFTVRAEDFRTPPTDLVLIPPPQLLRLARAELRPAYRLHPPPADGSLKSLQQQMGERELSLTGDRSVLTVPAGTAVELFGTADKPLASVRLAKKGGEAVSLQLNGQQFRLALPGGDRLTSSAEFDLTLADADGVTSSRTIVVQVTDDQPPQVELALDVLRKVGPNYLVSAAVRAPLSKDSIVRDDVGLADLHWRVTVVPQESAAAAGLALQLEALAGAATAGTLARGPRQTADLPVPAFARLADRLPRDTLAGVRQKLGKPPADAENVPAVREVRFAPDVDALDLLDFGAALERAATAAGRPAVLLRATDPGEVQPRYLVEAELVATDTDADTGPKVGRPLEPLRLLVVSEADLLAEVGRDEDKEAARLDETIRRVREAEVKLGQQAERLLPSDPPAEARLAARVRADDILQDVGKARDITHGVVGEYGRLRREVEANRCGMQPDEAGRPVSKVAVRFDTVVIRPLEAILAAEFAAADDALVRFRDALAADRRPADGVVADARTRLAALSLKLAAVRAALGESLSEKKLTEELRRLINQQVEVSAALAGLKDRLTRAKFAPKIVSLPPVQVAHGRSAVVKHVIDWLAFPDGELAVRFEYPPGNAVGGPMSVTVKDDRNELEYLLTAGDVAGEYVVRLVPAVGEPVEVKVIVK